MTSNLDRFRDMARELKHALRVPEVSLSRENGQLRLNIGSVNLPELTLLDMLAYQSEMPQGAALLGQSGDGDPVFISLFEKNMRHVLVAGGSGSGKTSLLRTMAISMSLFNRQSQLQLLIIAPDEDGVRAAYSELEPLTLLPHMLNPVCYRVDEASALLSFLLDELKYRQEQRITSPAIVVFVDGIVELLKLGGDVMHDAFARLLQHGDTFGVHLVLSTSRPESELLSELLRANLPVRIVGQVQDERSAYLASEVSGTQAEYLLGRGDFLAVVDGREIIRFQSAYVGEYDLYAALDDLQRKRPIPVLAQPIKSTSFSDPSTRDRDSDAVDAGQPFTFDGESVEVGTKIDDKGAFLDVDSNSEMNQLEF